MLYRFILGVVSYVCLFLDLHLLSSHQICCSSSDQKHVRSCHTKQCCCKPHHEGWQQACPNKRGAVYSGFPLVPKGGKLSLHSLLTVCWKQMSGATVTLADDRPGILEKVVQISGTPEQTEKAKSLLQGFILSSEYHSLKILFVSFSAIYNSCPFPIFYCSPR